MGLGRLKRIMLALGWALAAPAGQAGAETGANYAFYGSFVYDPDIPYALFMLGDIVDGDSFELRRAMRDQDIGMVVLDSPGGSVFEGLQIASIIQDRGLATYVPPDAMCASACSFVYFGGTRRAVTGDLGVHQFYSGGDAGSEQVSRDQESRSTQYTASEIIGILNEFGTPPFVYEKMFSTDDIYVFPAAQEERLALGKDDDDFAAWRAEIDDRYSEVVAGLQDGAAPVPAEDDTVVMPVPEESSTPFTPAPSEGGNNPFKKPNKKNPFAPTPTTDESAADGDWYVIMGDFAFDEIAAAQKLQGEVSAAMWGEKPKLLMTDSLPGFQKGHYILAYGPYTKAKAEARLLGVQNVVDEAYIDATVAAP